MSLRSPMHLTRQQKQFLRRYTFDYTLAVIFDNLQGLFSRTLYPAWILEFSAVATDMEQRLQKVRDWSCSWDHS